MFIYLFIYFLSRASFQEQWSDWGGIMGWFVPFLLPWDKQQLESSSTDQYLEQTSPSDCIKASEIRLNATSQRWRLYVLELICDLGLAKNKRQPVPMTMRAASFNETVIIDVHLSRKAACASYATLKRFHRSGCFWNKRCSHWKRIMSQILDSHAQPMFLWALNDWKIGFWHLAKHYSRPIHHFAGDQEQGAKTITPNSEARSSQQDG